jgi:glucose-6-phosphate 1-dehydrogenase
MADAVRAREATKAEGSLGSQTPTYAALKLFVDNWRWQGVHSIFVPQGV